MTDWMVVASDTQARLEDLQTQHDRLRAFYDSVAALTLRHDVIECVDGNEYASVAPSRLGPLLETVDPEWYRKVGK